MHILICNAITTPISTQDIIISRLRHHPPSHILKPNILNSHAIRGDTGRTTVQVVLLEVKAILIDIGESDVGVGDVGHAARGVEVCLDAETVGGVCDNGVGETVIFINV